MSIISEIKDNTDRDLMLKIFTENLKKGIRISDDTLETFKNKSNFNYNTLQTSLTSFVEKLGR